jgi:hypothetical protein
MSLFQYPLQRFTSRLGLALYGMEELLAENMLLIDAAYGTGSSINVNGSLVESPNLSSTTPSAPVGDQLVTFQFDSNGNISAYVPTPAPGGVTSLTGDSIVYNNASSVGAVTLSLISQVANTVFAGPTSGPNATPTFRALVAADIPTAANLPLWSNLQNAAGALTLANGANATTFNQTSAVAWLWANTTVATVSTTNASPLLELAAQYWATGAVTGTDLWTIKSSLAAGLNGLSTLTFAHTGSTGKAFLEAPGLSLAGYGSVGVTAGFIYARGLLFPATAGGSDWKVYLDTSVPKLALSSDSILNWAGGAATATVDNGISRLGAASLAIGNGTAGDTTGNLSFNKVIKYAGVATVSAGVPSELATVDLTAQSAAISATTLYAVPAAGAGMYRVTWVATITTKDAEASALGGTNGFQVSFTSPTDSVVKTDSPTTPIISAANTTGTSISGCEVVYAKASTNIQYAFGYTSSTPGQMIYELHIKCEAM